MIRNAAHLNNIIARRTQKLVEPWAMNYWHDAPLTQEPLASRQNYLDLWEKERATSYPDIDLYESDGGFAVGQTWFQELALHTQITIKNSALCYQHGRVLYTALRDYLARNTVKNLSIIETGTARGFSSTVMARALDDANSGGKILTLDLLPHDKAIYWNCIDDHSGQRTRRELLAPWKELTDAYVVFVEGDSRSSLQKLGLGRVHFAFLDGGHSYEDVTFEFEAIAKRQQKGDVIVFDDYNADKFPGIVEAVDKGCAKMHYAKRMIPGKDQRNYVIAQKTA